MSRPKIDRTGEVGVNTNGERMVIIRCGDVHDIDVQFDDGTIVEHRYYCHFKKGKIKNPMTPSFWGVGFIGKGRFKAYDENGKHTKCYDIWVNMLMRCYCSKYQDKNPTYKGCTLCQEWYNFQVFAEWYYEHYYEFGSNERMELDKDILNKRNKVYSPNDCIFVPKFINSLFIKSNKIRGKYHIGVYKDKNRNKFTARLNKYNKLIYLGVFNTPNEAFQAYKEAKEQYIKEVAEKYKSQIPYELYQAMMNYEVEIDD